jgi:hypothetical protein
VACGSCVWWVPVQSKGKQRPGGRQVENIPACGFILHSEPVRDPSDARMSALKFRGRFDFPGHRANTGNTGLSHEHHIQGGVYVLSNP